MERSDNRFESISCIKPLNNRLELSYDEKKKKNIMNKKDSMTIKEKLLSKDSYMVFK